MKRCSQTFSILIWHFYMVIFDPLVYPMDTAWIKWQSSADHYRHARPAFYRALERAHLNRTPTDPADAEQGIEPALAPVTDGNHRRSDH